MSEACTCGKTFRTGEDFRDHLPCPGTESTQTIEGLRKQVDALKQYKARYEECLVVNNQLNQTLVQNVLSAEAMERAKHFKTATHTFCDLVLGFMKNVDKERIEDKVILQAVNDIINNATTLKSQ